LLGSPASAAPSAPNGPPVCPLGFSIQTAEDALLRYGGSYTEQEIRAGFAEHDVNGNGFICGKPISRWDKAFPLQWIRDDLAKV
jgi:hypothetical protein